MKPLRVADGIIPLEEFKTKASAIIRALRTECSTLVITQNGRPAAVLMAPEEYDRLQEQQRSLEAVAIGLADAVADRNVDHARVASWLATWGTERETEPPR
jgi:prevent-host-death family protein